MILLQSFKSIYFIGIGGVSMSGLAEIMLHYGHEVAGSDLKNSSITKHLALLGAQIHIGHHSAHIGNPDLVVYTAAISPDNPELKAATKKNIPTLERADFLGRMMKDYTHPVAIAGTHGKTTTTGFVSSILLVAKKNPTILIGGQLDLINGYLHIGNREIFLTEACEYKRSFTKFHPQYAVVLNIEEDHLDYYKDLDDILDAFNDFANRLPEDGRLIYNSDCANSSKLFRKTQHQAITFGMKNSHVSVSNLNYTPYPEFELVIEDISVGNVQLSVPGEHNVYNALAAAACCWCMGLSHSDIVNGLNQFIGAKRRFQLIGSYNGSLIVDDYAHHPTEIKATLKTAKNMTDGRVLCVFQPHTYTRTLSLLSEFASSFDIADTVLIVDIYAAREIDSGLVHSKDLVASLLKNGVDAYYCDSFSSAKTLLVKIAHPSDIILTMGAGDVDVIGQSLIEKSGLNP